MRTIFLKPSEVTGHPWGVMYIAYKPSVSCQRMDLFLWVLYEGRGHARLEQYNFLKGNQLKGLKKKIKLPFLLLEEFSTLASAVIRGTWAFWRSASIGTGCTFAGIILAEEVLGTFLALHPWALPYRIQVNWSWTLLTLTLVWTSTEQISTYINIWTFAKFNTQSPTWHATAEFLRCKHVWRDLKQWVVDIIASGLEVWEGNGLVWIHFLGYLTNLMQPLQYLHGSISKEASCWL